MKATFRPNKNIRTLAARNAENLFKVISFAVATAQCPLLPSVRTVRLLESWGNTLGRMKSYAEVTQEEKSLCGVGMSPRKATNYVYLWENRESIFAKYKECLKIHDGHLIWWNYCMDVLCGMGLVKAAFCTQLLFAELGCIDVHNARILNVEMPAGKSAKARNAYLTIQSVKTSEGWWCDWCDFIADKYPHLFKHGEHVSALHEYAISGDESLINF